VYKYSHCIDNTLPYVSDGVVEFEVPTAVTMKNSGLFAT
jgi:hypothetical protein